MTAIGAFPAQDLTCPNPRGCRVLRDPEGFGVVSIPAGTPLFRVHDSVWGYDEANPGFGDARFSPIDDPVSAARLPSTYLAGSALAALLETVFHEVHQTSSRTIYEHELRGQLLAHVRLPSSAELVDLRDPELVRLGYGRDQVTSSSAEHYPCTRRLARALLAAHPRADGLLWHSRQAELLAQPAVEVAVLYGGARYPTARGEWPLWGPGSRNLLEGPGRLVIDELAESVGATVELEASEG